MEWYFYPPLKGGFLSSDTAQSQVQNRVLYSSPQSGPDHSQSQTKACQIHSEAWETEDNEGDRIPHQSLSY